MAIKSGRSRRDRLRFHANLIQKVRPRSEDFSGRKLQTTTSGIQTYLHSQCARG